MEVVIILSILAAASPVFGGQTLPSDSVHVIQGLFASVNPNILQDPSNYLVNIAGNYAVCQQYQSPRVFTAFEKTRSGGWIDVIRAFYRGDFRNAESINLYVRQSMHTWLQNQLFLRVIKSADIYGCSIQTGCSGNHVIACLFTQRDVDPTPQPPLATTTKPTKPEDCYGPRCHDHDVHNCTWRDGHECNGHKGKDCCHHEHECGDCCHHEHECSGCCHHEHQCCGCCHQVQVCSSCCHHEHECGGCCHNGDCHHNGHTCHNGHCPPPVPPCHNGHCPPPVPPCHNGHCPPTVPPCLNGDCEHPVNGRPRYSRYRRNSSPPQSHRRYRSGEPGTPDAQPFTPEQYDLVRAVFKGQKPNVSNFLEDLSDIETECSMLTINDWSFPKAHRLAAQRDMVIRPLFGVDFSDGRSNHAIQRILQSTEWKSALNKFQYSTDIGCSIIPDCQDRGLVYAVVSCIFGPDNHVTSKSSTST